MITVLIRGRKATRTMSEVITSGSAGQRIKFEFDDSWKGLNKIVCFSGIQQRDTLLDSKDECAIPWEAVKTPGVMLVVGVYGTDTTGVVVPTIYCELGIVRIGAKPSEVAAQEATPTVVAQIIATAQSANATAEEALEKAEEALENSEEAESSASAAATSAANAAESARMSRLAAQGSAMDCASARTMAYNAQTKAETVYNAYENGDLKGEKGDTGNSGVYIGSSEPTDDDVNVWIDPSGSAEGNWELIESFTLTSASSWSREKTPKPNSVPYDFKKVMVLRKYPKSCDLTGVDGYGRIRFFNASGSYVTTESAKPTANDKDYANLSIFEFERNMATLMYTRTTAQSNGAVPLNIKHTDNFGFSLGFGNCVKIGTPSDDKDPVGTIVTIYAIKA